MTGSRSSWTGPAATMATAVTSALAEAWDRNAGAFDAAVATLGRLDRSQVATLLGTMLRDLIERSHPDGLDSEDANEVLQSCARFAAGWYPDFGEPAAVQALVGALGVGEPDDEGRPAELAVLTHGLLLIADQLSIAGLDAVPVLDAALAELLRAQTIEMP